MTTAAQAVRDFDPLLESAFDLLNRLHKRQIPANARHLNDAHTLSKKVVMHCETSLHLLKESPERPDFASIAVLVRAAYEAYLLLFYVFAMPEADSERRYERWKLEGILRRTRVAAFQDPRPVKAREADADLIDRLQNRILEIVDRCNKIPVDGGADKFNSSSWRRWKPQWSRLAELAGLDQEKFTSLYAYLCGYAHGDSWTAAQIDQAPRDQNEPGLGATLVMLAVPVLCELLVLYPGIMGLDPAKIPSAVGYRFSAYRSFLRA